MSEVGLKEKESNDWDDDCSWDNWADAEDDISQLKKPTDLPQEEIDAENFSESVKSSPLNNCNELDERQSSKDVQGIDSKVDLTEKNEIHTKICKESRSSGWSSILGGVVSSVLSSASEGIGNITSTVSQGLDKVIGVPDPTELARINAQEESKIAKINNSFEIDKEETPYSLKFGTQLVSGVTNLGSKVISTGLDTLEGIGKKTMDILQENDPQIKHKIKMLTLEPEKPNLSQVCNSIK